MFGCRIYIIYVSYTTKFNSNIFTQVFIWIWILVSQFIPYTNNPKLLRYLYELVKTKLKVYSKGVLCGNIATKSTCHCENYGNFYRHLYLNCFEVEAKTSNFALPFGYTEISYIRRSLNATLIFSLVYPILNIKKTIGMSQ